MHSSRFSPRRAASATSWWCRLTAGLLQASGWLLLAWCAALAALSYYGFTLYCENFGCMGRGLVWMIWAVAACLGLVVALLVWSAQRRRGLGTQASGLAAVWLLLMGLGHLLYWLSVTAVK